MQVERSQARRLKHLGGQDLTEGDHHGCADGREVLVGARGDRRDAVVARAACTAPALQADERQPRALAMTTEAEAVDGEHTAHEIFLILEEVVARLIEGPLRELTRCARRRRWST